MNAVDVANAYIEWTKNCASLVHQQDGHVLLKTPLQLPDSEDVALTIVVSLYGKSLRISDGGKLSGFFWDRGIDLNSRNDAWGRIGRITETLGIDYANGEFHAKCDDEASPELIHDFCTELVAIAAQVYTLPSEFASRAKAAAIPRADTILRRYLIGMGLQLRNAMPGGELEQGSLYSHVEKSLCGLRHEFSLYLTNGSEYAVDTLDWAKLNGDATRRRTFELAAIHQKGIRLFGRRWRYHVAFTTPNRVSRTSEDNPVQFLGAEQDLALVPLTDEDSKRQLAETLMGAASSS